jgi:hypothetical protein
MLIEKSKIIADIRSELIHKYMGVMPELIDVIKSINDNPSTQYADFAYKKIANFPSIKSRLKVIYGQDADIQLFSVKPKLRKVVETFYVDEEKWDDWFKKFMRNDQTTINFFNSCYNSNKKKYLVSVVYMEAK